MVGVECVGEIVGCNWFVFVFVYLGIGGIVMVVLLKLVEEIVEVVIENVVGCVVCE